jgi:hypothetical protein
LIICVFLFVYIVRRRKKQRNRSFGVYNQISD